MFLASEGRDTLVFVNHVPARCIRSHFFTVTELLIRDQSIRYMGPALGHSCAVRLRPTGRIKRADD